VVGPPNGDIRFNGYASVAVYTQAYKYIQVYWPYRRFQIWRVSPTAGESFNQAFLTDVAEKLDPCNGDLDNKSLGSSPVSVGSTDTTVQEAFDFTDRNGNVIDTNCVFVAGGYAPTADSGLLAGTLLCDNGHFDCIRRYDNQATTCGGKAASDCGTLGKDCDRYYQHIADCRVG
jgi:hypothetical protein